MKAIVKTVVGKVEYVFEIEEQEEIQTLHKIAVLGNPPTFCNECGNENPDEFKLKSNKDAEANTYVNVVCSKCEATAKLGQYKSKGYFWHNFSKYVPKVK